MLSGEALSAFSMDGLTKTGSRLFHNSGKKSNPASYILYFRSGQIIWQYSKDNAVMKTCLNEILSLKQIILI